MSYSFVDGQREHYITLILASYTGSTLLLQIWNILRSLLVGSVKHDSRITLW